MKLYVTQFEVRGEQPEPPTCSVPGALGGGVPLLRAKLEVLR